MQLNLNTLTVICLFLPCCWFNHFVHFCILKCFRSPLDVWPHPSTSTMAPLGAKNVVLQITDYHCSPRYLIYVVHFEPLVGCNFFTKSHCFPVQMLWLVHQQANKQFSTRTTVQFVKWCYLNCENGLAPTQTLFDNQYYISSSGQSSNGKTDHHSSRLTCISFFLK